VKTAWDEVTEAHAIIALQANPAEAVLRIGELPTVPR
jgi:hypothetical protein